MRRSCEFISKHEIFLSRSTTSQASKKREKISVSLFSVHTKIICISNFFMLLWIISVEFYGYCLYARAQAHVHQHTYLVQNPLVFQIQIIILVGDSAVQLCDYLHFRHFCCLAWWKMGRVLHKRLVIRTLQSRLWPEKCTVGEGVREPYVGILFLLLNYRSCLAGHVMKTRSHRALTLAERIPIMLMSSHCTMPPFTRLLSSLYNIKATRIFHCAQWDEWII